MSRSSSRIPAIRGLTDAQRADIARSYKDERLYALAVRLGVPKKLVKAEVDRLKGRHENAPETAEAAEIQAAAPRRAVPPLIKIVAPALVGMSVLGFAIGYRDKHPVAAVEPVHIDPSRELVKTLYGMIDRNELTLDAIVPHLDDANEEVRLAAVRACVKASRGDSSHVLGRLNDSVERIRLATIQGLGEIGDTRAVGPLSEIALSRRSPAERGLALQILARMPEDTVGTLVAAIADPIASIRERAFDLVVRRVGKDLGFTKEQVQKEPAVVRDAFARFCREGVR